MAVRIINIPPATGGYFAGVIDSIDPRTAIAVFRRTGNGWVGVPPVLQVDGRGFWSQASSGAGTHFAAVRVSPDYLLPPSLPALGPGVNSISILAANRLSFTLNNKRGWVVGKASALPGDRAPFEVFVYCLMADGWKRLGPSGISENGDWLVINYEAAIGYAAVLVRVGFPPPEDRLPAVGGGVIAVLQQPMSGLAITVLPPPEGGPISGTVSQYIMIYPYQLYVFSLDETYRVRAWYRPYRPNITQPTPVVTWKIDSILGGARYAVALTTADYEYAQGMPLPSPLDDQVGAVSIVSASSSSEPRIEAGQPTHAGDAPGKPTEP